TNSRDGSARACAAALVSWWGTVPPGNGCRVGIDKPSISDCDAMNPESDSDIPPEPPAAGRNGPSLEESRLLAEISELATATLPERVFLEELLKRAMIGMRGEAGAIWMCDAQRRLVLQSEICLEATGFLQDPALRGAAEPQFAEVMRTGGAVAFQIEQQTPNGTPRRQSL